MKCPSTGHRDVNHSMSVRWDTEYSFRRNGWFLSADTEKPPNYTERKKQVVEQYVKMKSRWTFTQRGIKHMNFILTLPANLNPTKNNSKRVCLKEKTSKVKRTKENQVNRWELSLKSLKSESS